MRTIKDPKKKPELRRRPDPVEEDPEEDDRSTKSTPPKKRRTAKSPKDDSSSFNDSSSLIDNQSDILSERSSIIGDDDVSDISSLKSTPPKKRNYNRIVSKSPEINGDALPDDHVDSLEKNEKKPKGKKKGKNSDKLDNDVNENNEVHKKSPKAKKKLIKATNSEETSEINEAKANSNDKDKTVTKRKTSKKAAAKPKTDPPVDITSNTSAVKKKPGRKRKLSGITNENNVDNNSESKEESPAPKKGKKTKKQIQKEAQSELKRQTEELRKSQAEKSSLAGKDEGANNIIKSTKKKASPKKPQSSPEKEKKTANENCVQKASDDHPVNEKEVDETVEKPNNQDYSDHSGSDNAADEDSDDSSELDTSFDTINGDQRDNLDDPIPDVDIDAKKELNESIENGDSKLEQRIKCDSCGYVSKSKGGHTRHLRKCQPEKLGLEPDIISKPKFHKCEQCEYSAPKRVLVINHMRTHGIFQCKRCQFRTDNEDTLEEHSTLEHKDRSDCKFCKNCNRYVKCSEIPLEKHMEECQGRIPFKCPECSKEFQYESSLKCHVVSHYPDQPKLFSCDKCDYKSNYKANLKKHVRHIHEQRGERNVKCTECDKMFYTEDNMKRHLKLHSEEKPHRCDKEDCGKAFKTINGLKFHMLSHQTDRPYACEIEGCDRSFKTSRALSLHLNEFHKQAPKNYKCSEEGCDMAFYKKSHLDRHTDAHKDNRTHFCLFVTCTKAFRTAEALKVHTRVHTDEKPIKCDHCDYKCRQKSSITFHMKKKHPEMLPNDLTAPKISTADQEGDQLVSDNVTEKSINKADIDSDNSPVSENEQTGMSLNVSEETSIDSKHKDNSETRTPSLLSSSPLKSSVNHENPSDDNDSISNSTSKNVPSKTDSHSISDMYSTNSSNNQTETSSSEVHEVKDPPGSAKPSVKPKKTDMYEFQSEDESGDEMRPGLLRKDYDKDKPPLPPVNAKLLSDVVIPAAEVQQKPDEPEKPQKVRKKPGPKPKPKPEKPESDEVKVPKKRGRKKKSGVEKQHNEKSENSELAEDSTSQKAKPVKRGRGRSPKAKKEEKIREAEIVADDDDEDDDDDDVLPAAPPKRKGRPPKKKAKEETSANKVQKKRGRKKKVDKAEKSTDADIVPENGDATINYSEVESNEFFGDSTKDSMPDTNEMVQIRDDENDDVVDKEHDEENEHDNENEHDIVNENENEDRNIDNEDRNIDNEDRNIDNEDRNIDLEINDGCKEDEVIEEKMDVKPVENVNNDSDDDDDGDDDDSAFSNKLVQSENKLEEKKSDSESSDIGSDFDEDLKPPPAPRPPPMYDSEDGDIESGPENEDFNGSAMSNEPLRDFESSREISREISRDFESSRENIDDSVKTNEYINSVETSTPKDIIAHSVGTPGSANPYTRNDSVTNEHENPLSHHSSVPHTPSHNSVPPTPSANQDYPESRSIDHPGDRMIKTPVQGQTNEENTDESSMPEVDKDYVGRFFEEIQCNQVQAENQINRMSSLDENTKSQDKIVEAPRSDSGVPSSLTSNQTESSIQMQSPPADLSHKRIDLISPDRVADPHYQPRSESVHNRSSERIPSVPSFDPSYTGTIDPYSSSLSQRDSILRQTEPSKVPSPPSTSTSFMRFPESEAMLQRQRVTAPYDRNLQNLHRIAEGPLPQHNSSSPLLRHVPGREEMFSGAAAGVPGSMARNPFHGSWTGQDVRPTHWTHPTYLQQQSGTASSSLFGKDAYLPGREFMFDPSRGAADRNMFSSLSSAHSQRPELPHDTFQFDRFDLGSYLSSHGYNAAPSLPVDYTRGAHSSSQKTLDDRYRQPSTGITDFRSLPPTSSASEMFGMNSTFNFEKFYSRDPMYHSQHITDNTNNPFLPGVPSQHSVFGRDYPHRGFYTQNTPYPFMNMNDKNYPSASAKLGHSTDSVTPQRDLVTVPRPNMTAPDAQLQDPYRHHHSSMLYNMMNKYF